MNIQPSTAAINKLIEQFPEDERIIKLIYDIEGCGCAVDGVVQLCRVQKQQSEDAVAYAGPITLLYDPKQEVFFEDHLMLDYDSSRRGFSLKSKNQIYHSNLSITNC